MKCALYYYFYSFAAEFELPLSYANLIIASLSLTIFFTYLGIMDRLQFCEFIFCLSITRCIAGYLQY